MCGRFEFKESLNTLNKKLKKDNVDLIFDFEESLEVKQENIAPTENIFSVSYTEKQYKLQKVKWGIKLSKTSPLVINSRIETLKDKKMWFDLFSENRCFIPMTAFYEWIAESGKKIPQRISPERDNIFFVPAVYYKSEDTRYVSLITTAPNRFMSSIHNRMPVILSTSEAVEFLHNDTETNFGLCRTLSDTEKMRIEPSDISNSPRVIPPKAKPQMEIF